MFLENVLLPLGTVGNVLFAIEKGWSNDVLINAL